MARTYAYACSDYPGMEACERLVSDDETMFDSALPSPTPRLENPHATGGIAASRHTLAKHRYLEEKRSRLEAEATGRRRVAIEQYAPVW